MMPVYINFKTGEIDYKASYEKALKEIEFERSLTKSLLKTIRTTEDLAIELDQKLRAIKDIVCPARVW